MASRLRLNNNYTTLFVRLHSNNTRQEIVRSERRRNARKQRKKANIELGRKRQHERRNHYQMTNYNRKNTFRMIIIPSRNYHHRMIRGKTSSIGVKDRKSQFWQSSAVLSCSMGKMPLAKLRQFHFRNKRPQNPEHSAPQKPAPITRGAPISHQHGKQRRTGRPRKCT